RGGDFLHLAVNDLARICVNPDFCRIAGLDVRELRFLVIRLYPARTLDEWNYLSARRHQLSWPDLPFADAAVSRRKDFRVTKVHLRAHQGCFFGTQVGGKLEILRLQYTLLTPLCFGCELTGPLCGPGLDQVRLAAGILAGKVLFLRNRLLQILLCCRLSLVQALLAFAL